jgi:hypothetical protein
VFGVFGPAAPDEVLTDLLADSGYNFVIIGGRGSLPLKLLLTPRSSDPPHAAQNNKQAAANWEDADPELSDPLANPDVDSSEHTLQRLKHLHEQQDLQNASK